MLVNKFNTIVIRDMFWSQKNNNTVNKIDVEKLKKYVDPKLYKDFTQKYKDIDTNEKLYHLALKCDYKDNWESELRENYFSFNFESFIALLNKFEIKYYNYMPLPFIWQKFKEIINLDLSQPTHIKTILTKK